MDITNTRQFKLLLWKNWLLFKKTPSSTILTVFTMPFIFMCLILSMRGKQIQTSVMKPTFWASFEANTTLPSKLRSQQIGQLRHWELAYTPSNPVVEEIVKDAAMLLNRSTSFLSQHTVIKIGQGFIDEATLVTFFANKTAAETTLCGICFDKTSFNHNGDLVRDANITYKIRFRAEGFNGVRDIWNTGSFFDPYFVVRQIVGPRGNKFGGPEPDYYNEGFLAVQRAVDSSITSKLTGSSTTNVDVHLKSFPYPPYKFDPFATSLSSLGLLVFVNFSLSIVLFCGEVVLDKELKLKESMKLMGMKAWLYWLALFFKFAMILLVLVIFLTFCLHVKFFGPALLNYTDWSITFVLLLLFAMSSITSVFAVSAFFSNASLVSNGYFFIVEISYAIFFYIKYINTSVSTATVMSSSLLSGLGLIFGFEIIASLEMSGVGIQWSTIDTPVLNTSFTMLHVFAMLAVDTLLYAVIAWYFDAVLPRKFGVPHPFYFPFMKWYWCGRTSNASQSSHANVFDYKDLKMFFEDPPTNSKVGISVRNLTKKFKRSQRPAVDKLNLDIYEDQITALLGQNGAGKTTLMLMLSGVLPATAGTTTVKEYDIQTSLGICFQHNVLFDSLTVEEHLIFFANLKGCPVDDITSEVNAMIEVLHLADKRHVASGKLSGGLKRSLCVGIALIAKSKSVQSKRGPEVLHHAAYQKGFCSVNTLLLFCKLHGIKYVLLDEPSSGLDPESRRRIWDVFQSQRAGRTIILSTHSMDEADVLGDRIAIMDDGQLMCCGSSLFLKTVYGIGYHLIVIKRSTCIVDRLVERVKGHVDSAQLVSNIGSELSFLLPRERLDKFEKLFNDLEQNSQQLGIDQMGISGTFLEEVFMKATKFDSQSNPQNGISNDTGDSKQGNISFGVKFRRVTGVHCYLKQLRALLVKRALHSLRSFLLVIFDVSMFIAVLVWLCLSFSPTFTAIPDIAASDRPALLLSLEGFPGLIIASASDSAQAVHPIRASYREVAKGYGKIVELNAVDLDRDYMLMKASNLSDYNQHYLTAGSVTTSVANPNKVTLTSHFNNYALHVIAISLSMADNAVLQNVDSPRVDPGLRIQTINHPLPLQNKSHSLAETDIIGKFIAVIFSYFISYSIYSTASNCVVFLVNERAVKAKHAQFIAGVRATNFWLSNLLWDGLYFLVLSILVVLCMVGFQLDGYSRPEVLRVVILDLVLNSWSLLTFIYLFSLRFNVASSAMSALTLIFFVGGFIGAAFSLMSFVYRKELQVVLYILLPTFCFEITLSSLYLNYRKRVKCLQVFNVTLPTDVKSLCEYGCCSDVIANGNYFAWEAPGAGQAMVCMAIKGLVFLFLLFAIDSDLIRRFLWQIKSKKTNAQNTNRTAQEIEDEDVRAERDRINGTSNAVLAETDKVNLRELSKLYKKKQGSGENSILAVDRLSLGIPSGECFGLLGVNGAGKTTTFEMLTNDSTITAGEVILSGLNVEENGQKAMQGVGFCPQFDSLIDQMTVTETLWMYARINGVVEKDIKRLVDTMLQQLTLKKHAKKQNKDLSGGNRRKVCVGIALMGTPSIVFLDEPTTGLDPIARRIIWNLFSAVRSRGATMILTSHSMEECEALCTRLAIMVNGQFQCLGSNQHLKIKFNEGYSLILKVHQDPADRISSVAKPVLGAVTDPDANQNVGRKTRRVKDFVEKKFPGSQLQEQVDGLLRYRILAETNKQLSWAYVFGQIEKAKVELDIESYSVSQATLEQIFIRFAKLQRPADEVTTGTTLV